MACDAGKYTPTTGVCVDIQSPTSSPSPFPTMVEVTKISQVGVECPSIRSDVIVAQRIYAGSVYGLDGELVVSSERRLSEFDVSTMIASALQPLEERLKKNDLALVEYRTLVAAQQGAIEKLHRALEASISED